MEFQIYDWREDFENDVGSDGETNDTSPAKYIIHIFGRTEDDRSVYCKVTDYKPYFYVLIPQSMQDMRKGDLKQKMGSFKAFLKGDQCKVHWTHRKSLSNIELVKMKRASHGFENDKEFYFAKLVFNNYDAMKKYKYYFEGNKIRITSFCNKDVNYRLYEANLPPMFRCFHIQDITGCAWVSIENYEFIETNEATCDIQIKTPYTNLKQIFKKNNAPFKIASFDIECTSCDGEFPQAKRREDKIIQIGITYTYIGKSIPYRKYICCLNETSKIDGIDVVSCQTEEDLLEAFAEEIKTSGCDIMTGYNIFGFDNKYINDRAVLLKCSYLFSGMSKLVNFECPFVEKNLSSSAMGVNILYLWDTPGIVHIDLLKDIQKTFNLDSYKLDNVSSKFIRGRVNKYEIDKYVRLYCDSINDIFINDYIHIEIQKGFISDNIGEKFLIKKIDNENKILYVKMNDNEKREISETKNNDVIYWSQAKDDVGPKDIFRLYKGSPDDRAIVAKYCVKDCMLVSLLMNKLEVVTKNIEMANVCTVPLSYLFLRGQGIKLFSLVLKEYRNQGYAFPVIKKIKNYICSRCRKQFKDAYSCPQCFCKNKIEIEDESSSYEGAIVFDPVPNVDYEASATKDYMSLYPASIMQKNMSHETQIIDTRYDDIEGITYYNAQYRENDGSIQYRRYAKNGDKLGVIPTILDNLLKTRKAIKKEMGIEKDTFRAKILDAKQLAVKITANSLYGQLGAQTSPVCMRDIAACTTSTGREMLILAKKYDEEQLPYIINGLKNFYETNDLDKVAKLLDIELKARDDKNFITRLEKYITKDIGNLIFQPVVRYGDTDSIFSCYRYRENTVKLNTTKANNILSKIIIYGRKLIVPFLSDEDKDIFTEIYKKHFNKETIKNCIIPQTVEFIPKPSHNNIISDLDIRFTQLIKELVEESLIPWIWTLSELVEKNNTFMFDIKLTGWAKHQLEKIKYEAIDLVDKREKYIMEPLNEIFSKIYNDKYINSANDIIYDVALQIKNKMIYSNEITLDEKELIKQVDILMNKTIRDKWELNDDKREVNNIIKKLFDENLNEKDYNFIEYKKLIIEELNNINRKDKKQKEKDIMRFKSKLLELNFVENIGDKIIDFIKEYDKVVGKKSLYEIIMDFSQKILKLDFNKYKNEVYNDVINFIKENLIYEDEYIWTQPRLDFNGNDKVYYVDVHVGGKPLIDKRALDYGMEMGKLSGELVKSHLPFPHDLEYEKTFWPFGILKKKKYVGNKYEFDNNKFKFDYMGVVLKRRDNAPIVKEICNGIIDYLINKRDPTGAKQYTRDCLDRLFSGGYDIKYFLQSRNLKPKSSYKDWKKIAHVYLANKIEIRSPGNAPQSGDRISFAVIKVDRSPTEKLLQGDIIETPEYIKEKGLNIDYLFYLTNQIMNPAMQFLELVDKDAKDIFNEYIEMYSVKKPIKNKVVKNKIINVKPIKIPIKIDRKLGGLNSKLKQAYECLNFNVLDNLIEQAKSIFDKIIIEETITDSESSEIIYINL